MRALLHLLRAVLLVALLRCAMWVIGAHPDEAAGAMLAMLAMMR